MVGLGVDQSKNGIRSVGIVGGGVMGSWAALHLAEAGIKATLYEPFPAQIARGSSRGRSRAFRFLGDLELVRLDYSEHRWRALGKQVNDTLLIKTGLLNFGPREDPFFEKHMGVLITNGRPCEWLNHDDIKRRFPMLRYPKAWGAAWDPNGGILLADRCLSAVQREFERLGGQIVLADVKSIRSLPGSEVQIEFQSALNSPTSTEIVDRLIVCAGPWTGKLLPMLDAHLKPLFTPVTYWRDKHDSYSVANGFPILFNARLTNIYGLPSLEYPGLVKILYHGGAPMDPDRPALSSLAPYVEQVSQYIREYLPGLDASEPAVFETCMYTMTKDNEPIIDRLSSNITVGCGFSGSGFKNSPATGQMLAAYALEMESRLPVEYATERFRFDRFI